MQEKNSNLFFHFFSNIANKNIRYFLEKLSIFEKKPISVKKILNTPQKFILYEEIYSLIQKEICFFFLPYKNSINYLFTSKSKQTFAADVFKKPQVCFFFKKKKKKKKKK